MVVIPVLAFFYCNQQSDTQFTGNYAVLFAMHEHSVQLMRCSILYLIYFLDQNILVHQTCSCLSPIHCKCPGGEGVKYVLGDMGLFWEDKKHGSKYMKWAKERSKEPPGTPGMQAPEVKTYNRHYTLYKLNYKAILCGNAKWEVL